MEVESSAEGVYAHLLKPFPVLKLVDVIAAAEAGHAGQSE